MLIPYSHQIFNSFINRHHFLLSINLNLLLILLFLYLKISTPTTVSCSSHSRAVSCSIHSRAVSCSIHSRAVSCSVAPITQQQSLAPITLPVPPSITPPPLPPLITPPPLPPSITSPQLPHSITQTPVSTPPLSDGLLDPDEVIANYPELRNIGRLAVRLASESYFGKELLKRSTVYGLKSNASLPSNKVSALKKKLCNLYPQYVDTPAEFEPVWTKCVNAINHHASGLHKKNKDGVIINVELN